MKEVWGPYGPSPLFNLPFLGREAVPNWWTSELAWIAIRWNRPNPYCTWQQLWLQVDVDVRLLGTSYLYRDEQEVRRIDPATIYCSRDREDSVIEYVCDSLKLSPNNLIRVEPVVGRPVVLEVTDWGGIIVPNELILYDADVPVVVEGKS